MRIRKSKIYIHPFFKLGKAPAKRDKRNIRFAAVLKKLPPVPAQWDFDIDIAKNPIPVPVFANDWLGDCVIAGRAHMTLRLEYFEQGGKILPITDKIVIDEYKREGGSMSPGQQGLIMLDSLNCWRKKGWTITRQKYSIHAFTELKRGDINEIKVAIRYLGGAYVGIALPDCWRDQIDRGQPWDIIPGPEGKPNPQNGHCVYICGYTSSGPVCVTWGRKQSMTWNFLAACCDEAYAIVDDRDSFVKNSPVDLKKLDGILDTLK
jgi:hypothetical protein